MSKLSNLTRQAKSFNIGGVELKLRGRGLKELDLLMDLADENKRSEAMKRLIFVTLKEAESDATDEEINDFGMQNFQQLTEAIIEVNGLKNATNNIATGN